MTKLSEVQILELEEDLEDLEIMIESCPTSDSKELRRLCDIKEKTLTKLGRWTPFFKTNKHKCGIQD